MRDLASRSRARVLLTAPLAPAIAILAAALAVLAASLRTDVPPTLAWVVVALAAGYAISGSV